MSDKPDKKPNEAAQPSEQPPPDKRGPRPTDPNALAKWIVEQTTNQDFNKAGDPSSQSDGSSNKPGTSG